MSHTKTMKLNVRKYEGIVAACKAMDLPIPESVPARHKLYGSQTAFGIAVKPKGWKYPMVFNLDDGTVQYDQYGCDSGTHDALDRFVNRYAMEELRIHACDMGFELQNLQELENGSFVFELLTVDA